MSFLDEEKYSATSLKHPADLQTWPETANRAWKAPGTQDKRLGKTRRKVSLCVSTQTVYIAI